MTALDLIEKYLRDNGIDFEKSNEKSFFITLTGEKKLQTHCALTVGKYSLSASAFVIRKPDENAEVVLRWCMEKNASLPGIAFAANSLGDLYLVGKLPISALTEKTLDHLIGAIASTSDAAFNPLLEIGFANAIRREWAWRLSRGESLANLEAFTHLI